MRSSGSGASSRRLQHATVLEAWSTRQQKIHNDGTGGEEEPRLGHTVVPSWCYFATFSYTSTLCSYWATRCTLILCKWCLMCTHFHTITHDASGVIIGVWSNQRSTRRSGYFMRHDEHVMPIDFWWIISVWSYPTSCLMCFLNSTLTVFTKVGLGNYQAGPSPAC